jgi:hypothetical protein
MPSLFGFAVDEQTSHVAPVSSVCRRRAHVRDRRLPVPVPQQQRGRRQLAAVPAMPGAFAYLMGLVSFAYLMSLCLMQTWQHSPCMGVADEAADDDYRCHECDPAKPKLKVSHILVVRSRPFRMLVVIARSGVPYAAKCGRHSLVHFVLVFNMNMPPTFCRVRYFSTFFMVTET